MCYSNGFIRQTGFSYVTLKRCNTHLNVVLNIKKRDEFWTNLKLWFVSLYTSMNIFELALHDLRIYLL